MNVNFPRLSKRKEVPIKREKIDKNDVYRSVSPIYIFSDSGSIQTIRNRGGTRKRNVKKNYQKPLRSKTNSPQPFFLFFYTPLHIISENCLSARRKAEKRLIFDKNHFDLAWQSTISRNEKNKETRKINTLRSEMTTLSRESRTSLDSGEFI